jgi:hypothetical protein
MANDTSKKLSPPSYQSHDPEAEISDQDTYHRLDHKAGNSAPVKRPATAGSLSDKPDMNKGAQVPGSPKRSSEKPGHAQKHTQEKRSLVGAPTVRTLPHNDHDDQDGPSTTQTEAKSQRLVPIPPCTTANEIYALVNAMGPPPISKESLEELELGYIQSNVTLRIDINFDHDLHFTPVAGDKGAKKRVDASAFWLALGAELRIVYQHSLTPHCAKCHEMRSGSHDRQAPQVFKPRLPLLFQTLRELLDVLVPAKDRYQLDQHLDVPFLMQELSHGLLDIDRLAQWLDVLLTSHCAPLRDRQAHNMAARIRQGVAKGDIDILVEGLQLLFQMLELMKLDVANHQIRTLRFFLIDDTVTFQQDFFRLKIDQGELDIVRPREWYGNLQSQHQDCQIGSQTPATRPILTLVHGMLDDCVHHDGQLPITFKYDAKRLKEIRVEFQDFIHLHICLYVFDELLREVAALNTTLSPHEMSERLVMETCRSLQNRVMDITDGNSDDMPQIWSFHVESIAVELSRAATEVRQGVGAPIQDQLIAKATAILTKHFEDEHREHLYAKRLQLAIEQEVQQHVATFRQMTEQDMSHAQKRWRQSRAQRFSWRLLPEVPDMARRLLHMATIHWRVWAELTYMRTDDGRALVGDADAVANDNSSRTAEGTNSYVQHRLEVDIPRG